MTDHNEGFKKFIRTIKCFKEETFKKLDGLITSYYSTKRNKDIDTLTKKPIENGIFDDHREIVFKDYEVVTNEERKNEINRRFAELEDGSRTKE